MSVKKKDIVDKSFGIGNDVLDEIIEKSLNDVIEGKELSFFNKIRFHGNLRDIKATIDKDVEEALTGEDVTSQMKEKIKERLGYWSMMGAKVEEVAP